jgi:hypothetical protein
MTAEMDISETDLDYPLPMDTVKAQPHKHYSMVDSAIKSALQGLSAERIANSSDFGKLLGRIEAYRKQKSEKLIPRRKETSMEKEEEKQFDNKAERDKIFLSDFYNEEILSVAIDYVKSLASANSLVTK